MPQYVTITGDSRFEGHTDVFLIPGLHGVGLVDGRKVSIIGHGSDLHAVPSDQVEVWSTYTGHPDSGLRYQSSDKGGYRIARVNRDTEALTILASITGASEGDPAETELYARYTRRVNVAIEALGE